MIATSHSNRIDIWNINSLNVQCDQYLAESDEISVNFSARLAVEDVFAVTRMEFSHDNRYLAAYTSHGVVCWDMLTNSQLWTKINDSSYDELKYHSLHFNGVDTRLLISLEAPDKVSIVDAQTGSFQQFIEYPVNVNEFTSNTVTLQCMTASRRSRFRFSYDGSRVAGLDDELLLIWDSPPTASDGDICALNNDPIVINYAVIAGLMLNISFARSNSNSNSTIITSSLMECVIWDVDCGEALKCLRIDAGPTTYEASFPCCLSPDAIEALGTTGVCVWCVSRAHNSAVVDVWLLSSRTMGRKDGATETNHRHICSIDLEKCRARLMLASSEHPEFVAVRFFNFQMAEFSWHMSSTDCLLVNCASVSGSIYVFYNCVRQCIVHEWFEARPPGGLASNTAHCVCSNSPSNLTVLL